VNKKKLKIRKFYMGLAAYLQTKMDADAQRAMIEQTAARQAFVIKENSTLMKVLSAIPLLGIIPTYIQENSLGSKIELSADAPRLVQLIEVKNQYKVMNIVRDLLSIALAVAGVAFGVLTAAGGGVCLGIFALSIGVNVYRITENKTVIDILQTKGFVPGLVAT
jgi:hypothetical protein